MDMKTLSQKFFRVEIGTLPSPEPIPFNVYLYLAQNQHLMLWRAAGELIEDSFAKKYQDKGILAVWIRNDEEAAYHDYRRRVENPLPTDGYQPKTIEGAIVAETINSPSLSEPIKQEIVSNISKQVMGEMSSAQTPEEEQKAHAKATSMVQDVVALTSKRAHSVVDEIWKITQIEPDLKHSVDVASYAVIFSMAFGRIDAVLIRDIATAALLHDIGICKIKTTLCASPWQHLDTGDFSEYSSHVTQGMKIIENHGAMQVSARAVSIMLQHHEKFDGTGYPEKRKGFYFDDIAQIVAMAELVSSLSDGRLDGKKRTFKESFDYLAEKEKSISFPEYFNPDIFQQVYGWIHQFIEQSKLDPTIGVIGSQMKKLAS